MSTENTGVKVVVGAQADATRMLKGGVAVTGGVTAGVAKDLNNGTSIYATATGGYRNASVDLKFDNLFNDNFGITTSLGAGYVRGNDVPYTLRAHYCDESVIEVMCKDATSHAGGIGQNVISGEIVTDGVIEINGMKPNRQWNMMGKVGGLFTNDKKNLSLELGVKAGYIASEPYTIETEVPINYKGKFQLSDGSEHNIVHTKKVGISVIDKAQGFVASPYGAVKCNVAKGLNLKAEASLLGASVGINYIF